MKTFFSAAPHQAATGYLAWNGWGMTQTVTTEARKRALSAAMEMLSSEEDARGVVLLAFKKAEEEEGVVDVLVGKLDYSQLQGMLYGATDATLETYSALAKLGGELDLRIAGLDVASRLAFEKGEVRRSRNLEHLSRHLSTLRMHITVLTVVSGGLWHLQSQEG